MESMEIELASVAIIQDQRQKLQQYRHILSIVVASKDYSSLNKFIRHMLSDEVPSAVSRQLLQTLAVEIGKLENKLGKEIADDTFQELQPRVVLFPEALTIKEKLAELYESEEQCCIDDADKLSKCAHIAPLYLEDDDAEASIDKASFIVSSSRHEELNWQKKLWCAQTLDMKGNFLEAAQCYYDICQIAKRQIADEEIDEATLDQALSAAVTCLILAGAGPRRSQALATLYKDERVSKLKIYSTLEKVYLEKILSIDEIDAFAEELKPHQKAILRDKFTVLDRAMIEHNLLCGSKLYTQKSFDELCTWLHIPLEKAEKIAVRIFEDRMKGLVDQLRNKYLASNKSIPPLVKILKRLLVSWKDEGAEAFIDEASNIVSSRDEELNWQHKLCCAQFLDMKRNFLEAALCYYDICQIEKRQIGDREIDEAVLEQALSAAVTCLLLAGAGPRRSRVLATLYKDERVSKLKIYPILKKVYLEKILSKDEIDTFAEELKPHQKVFLPGQFTVLDRAMIEHNLLSGSKHYPHKSFDELCAWLDIPLEKAEKIAARLIFEDRMRVSVDHDMVIPSTSESFDFLNFPLFDGDGSNVTVAVIDSVQIVNRDASIDDESRFIGVYETVGEICDKCIGHTGPEYIRTINAHGFFCSAIIASKRIPHAMIRDLDLGCLRGLDAPPRLLIYGVGCPSCGYMSELNMARGIYAAIQKKVDVISMSLSRIYPALLCDETDPNFHARDIAMLEALKNNIVTVVPAGNEGIYGLQSVMKGAPWCLVVASCTPKRSFWTNLILNDGVDQISIEVKGLNVIAADDKWEEVSFNGLFSADKPARMYKEGSNFAVVNSDEKKTIPPNGCTIIYIPVQHCETLCRMRINAEFDGSPLFAKIRSSHKIEIPDTPLVSAFSGKGPCYYYKELMKPDLCAPGEGIAAAWPGDVPLSGGDAFNVAFYGNVLYADYNVLNGTSFAVPHVAAAAAALRAQNNFSATAIISALITSATKMHGKNKFQEFAYGAGMINLKKALRPGLVYEETFSNFEAWFKNQLPHFVLNLASMSATFPSSPEKWTFSFYRRVRSVESGSSRYTGRVEVRYTSLDVPLADIKITLSNSRLVFDYYGDEKTFTLYVSIPCTREPIDKKFGLVSGSLIWQNEDNDDISVVSPIILSSRRFPLIRN